MNQSSPTLSPVQSFSKKSLKGTFLACYRSEKEFSQFLLDPDQNLERYECEILKKHGTTTVTVVRDLIQRCPVVIKRYNTKNRWHAFRRTLRRSRAENCWIYAEKLEKLGIKIAPRVAFVQAYLPGGLRRHSWYISEFVSGFSCLEHLPKIEDTATREYVMEQIVEMMAALRDHRISHGDMKATNLLLTTENQVVLLDLDAMKEHATSFQAHNRARKDVDRFLRNWRDKQPALCKLAQEKLTDAGFVLSR